MIYNKKYNVYVDNDFIIYYWNKKLDKLLQKPIYENKKTGYFQVNCVVNSKYKVIYVHRIIFETFIGNIEKGYEIDHINTNKSDNRLCNLRLVTHIENMNNPKSLHNKSNAMKGNCNTKGKVFSIFGVKFKEHFGITRYQNYKLYTKEYKLYKKLGYCSWEVK